MSLSTELTHAIAHRLHRDPAETPETQALAPLLKIQQKWSQLPDDETLLIEHTHVTVDSLRPTKTETSAKGKANRVIRKNPKTPTTSSSSPSPVAAPTKASAPSLPGASPATLESTVEATQNDYGFSLSSARLPPSGRSQSGANLLTTNNLVDDLLACLNATELARRQFRDIARVAGLIVANYPGQEKPVASSRPPPPSSSTFSPTTTPTTSC